MNDKEKYYFKKERVRTELTIKILKTIRDFESEEEPDIKLSNEDIINVLSSMIVKRTD